MKQALLGFSAVFLVAIIAYGSNKANGSGKVQTSLPTIDPHAYAGSKKCESCHKSYYQTWHDSGHNQMIRPAIPRGPNRTILADFSKPDPNRPINLKDVKWVIGHRWKQRFIGVVDGQEVVFPGQWSIKDQKWQPYTAKSDWWYPQHQNWKTRSNFELCAGCHSTGVDIQSKTWTEQNITCESCHGPGKAHVEKPTVENIVNPSRLSTQRSMEVCLSCHQAGKTNGEQYAWPVGYQPGKVLGDYWHGFEPMPGKQSAEFWANGTAHKNRVQGNTFLRSVMHANGLQCSSCHDAHGSRNVSMTIKSASTNALCMTCHGPDKSTGPKYKVLSDHTHHGLTSTGSQCIGCHMSKTGENSVGAESRDHTFDFVSPSVSVGTRLPNSCNLCHADKTPEWALGYVKLWYPKLKDIAAGE